MSSSVKYFLLATVYLASLYRIEAQMSFRKANHDGACGVKTSELDDKEIEPTHYTLALGLDLNKEKFGGSVEIDVSIVGRKEERANEIWLNADESIDIKTVQYETLGTGSILSSLLMSAGKNVDVLEACLNTKHKVLVLTLADELRTGSKGKLRISYDGQYGEFGLRKKSHLFHSDESEPDVMFSLKSNHVRRLLPCFDNSHFKSTFKLSVKRFPHLNAISNTDKEFDLFNECDQAKIVSFIQTPPIQVDELKLEMRV